MTSIKKLKQMTALLASLIAMLLVYFIFSDFIKQPEKPLTGTFLTPSKPLATFNLLSTQGRPLNTEVLRGQWTLLFFGYSRCGSVCPATLKIVSNALMRMDEKKHLKPNFIMITLDAKHDTPSTLKTYLQTFNRDFIGAIGAQQEVKSFANSLGIVFDENSNRASSEAFTHSGTLVLVNPHAEVSAYFSPPFNAEQLAHDLLISVS